MFFPQNMLYLWRYDYTFISANIFVFNFWDLSNNIWHKKINNMHITHTFCNILVINKYVYI